MNKKPFGIAIKWKKGLTPEEESFWYETKQERDKAYRIAFTDKRSVSVEKIER